MVQPPISNVCYFVPQRYVRLVWQAVKANMPQLLRVKEFVVYYEESWLVGSYRPPFWNVFESGSIRPRAINHVKVA